MLTLQTPLKNLYGVGEKTAGRLERLGIANVSDLIFYFPRRWDDFTKVVAIRDLRPGQIATIRAKVSQIKNERSSRKGLNLTKAILVDEGGQIPALWFGQYFLPRILRPGTEWIFCGKVEYQYPKGLQFVSPAYERQAQILPVYSETEGLTSKYLRKIIRSLLRLSDQIKDFLPSEVRGSQGFLALSEAVRQIHFPSSILMADKARHRLAFDELFLIALRVVRARQELAKSNAPKIKIDKKLLQDFVKKLPYQLTDAQRRSAWEILLDLEKSRPMNRLLEGEVGSGKTVVAAMAALTCAKNQYQSVWLAPTEILAGQHFESIKKLLQPFGLKIGLLTSAQKIADLANDDLIIGTHALLQKDIKFKNLGLVIVDEQHRFGVEQRAVLRRQTTNNKQQTTIPHFLSLTATPIPRTLALALYGDLDISIIDELPAERQKIITRVVEPSKRNEAYQFIGEQIKAGQQAFVICPLIEDAGGNKKVPSLFELDRKSAVAEYKKLKEQIFPDLKIGLLHGRLKSAEKTKTMADFREGKIDILVSTAVVEVGIDVPNATVMMIEGAERFGLAQLHQFRGRVGRGEHQSYCFLFAESWSENTRGRLEAMERYDNGFELAEVDLRLRGPGELAGIAQSGLPDLKMASLTDTMLVKQAREEAEKIVEEGLENFPELQKELEKFESQRHLE